MCPFLFCPVLSCVESETPVFVTPSLWNPSMEARKAEVFQRVEVRNPNPNPNPHLTRPRLRVGHGLELTCLSLVSTPQARRLAAEAKRDLKSKTPDGAGGGAASTLDLKPSGDRVFKTPPNPNPNPNPNLSTPDEPGVRKVAGQTGKGLALGSKIAPGSAGVHPVGLGAHFEFESDEGYVTRLTFTLSAAGPFEPVSFASTSITTSAQTLTPT